MKLTIDATLDELSALADALELADALISQSEYTDRKHAANEKNAARRAWKISHRLLNAAMLAEREDSTPAHREDVRVGDGQPASTLSVDDTLHNAAREYGLCGPWTELPHGTYRTSHGVSWFFQNDREDLIEVVFDQEHWSVYHVDRAGVRRALREHDRTAPTGSRTELDQP